MRSINPANKNDNRKISIIIPAAGMGTRMKSHGPKSLIKINKETTILDNQLKYIYSNFNNPQVIIVTGFGAGKIEKHVKNRQLEFIYNDNWEIDNVGGSISKGIKHIKHKYLLILYGDLVFNKFALNGPFGEYSVILKDKYGLMKDEEVGCVTNDKKITNMMYDLPNKWAQISYFTYKELDKLKELCNTNQYNNHYGFELINKIIGDGGTFFTQSPKNMKITDIDSSKDLLKIKEII